MEGGVRMSSFRKIEGAGGVLLKEGEILVVHEISTNKGYGKVEGMLSVPMGSRVPREIWSDTAQREFLEETGYRVKPLIPYPFYFVIPEVLIQIFWVVLANENEAVAQTQEGLDPQWMKLDQFLLHEFVRYPSKEAALQIVQLIKDVAEDLKGRKRQEFLDRYLGSCSGN